MIKLIIHKQLRLFVFLSWLVLLTNMISSNAYALTDDEKNQIIMEQLTNSALVGSAIEATIRERLYGDRTSDFDNVAMMNALMQFNSYKSPALTNISEPIIKYSQISDAKKELLTLTLDTIDENTKYLKFGEFLDKYQITSVIKLGMDTYDLVDNFSKFFDEDGSLRSKEIAGLKVANNVYTVYAGAASILYKIPSTKVVSFMETHPLAKGLMEAPSKTLGKVLGAASLGVQISAKIYMTFRDNIVEDINKYTFLRYKGILELRLKMLEKLTQLYLDREKDGLMVEAGDIDSLFTSYGIHQPEYSTYRGQTFVLTDIFDSYRLNSTYLNNNYGKTAFTELSNDDRILVALDALTNISLKEDAEIQAYLQKIVAEKGGGFLDVLYSVFEGEGIYDIYDITSLLQAMFPYYDTGYSGFDYYDLIFKASFNSGTAAYKQQVIADLGRKIKRLKDAAQAKAERDAALSRLVHISLAAVGDPIAVYFGQDVEFREEIFKASTLGLPYRFSYRIDNQPSQYIEATYDEATGALVFNSPTDQPYDLLRVSIPQPPYYEGDTQPRLHTFPLPVGNAGVSVENRVLIDDKVDNNCPVGSTEIACRVGNYSIMKEYDYVGSVREISAYGGYIYAGTHDGKIVVFDLNGDKLFINDFPEYVFRDKLTVIGDYMYTTSVKSGDNEVIFMKFDMREPSNIQLVFSSSLGIYSFSSSVFYDGYAFISSYGDSYFIDYSDENNLQVVSLGERVDNPVLVGDYIYGYGYDGLYGKYYLSVLNFSDKSNIESYSVGVGEVKYGVFFNGKYYLFTPLGVDVYDISNPVSPVLEHHETGFVISPNHYVMLSDHEILDLNSSSVLDLYDLKIDKFPKVFSISANYEIAYGDGYLYLFGSYNAPEGSKTVINKVDATLRKSTATRDSLSLDGSVYRYFSNNSGVFYDNNYESFRFDQYGNIVSSYNPGRLCSDKFSILEGYDSQSGLYKIDFFNIEDASFPIVGGSVFVEEPIRRLDCVDNKAYLLSAGLLHVYDISDVHSPELLAKNRLEFNAFYMQIVGKFVYIGSYGSSTNGDPALYVFDLSDSYNAKLLYKKAQFRIDGMYANDGYLYAYASQDMKSIPSTIYVIDIKNPSNINIVSSYIPTAFNFREGSEILSVYAIKGVGDVLYLGTNQGILVVDVSNKYSVKSIGIIEETKSKVFDDNDFSVNSNNSELVFHWRSSEINEVLYIDLERAISNLKLINSYINNTRDISLTTESPLDYRVSTGAFTKTWTFNQDISTFDIEIVSNSYTSTVDVSSFVQNGNTLSITLTPNLSLPTNQLVLKMSDGGTPVKVSGSDTFWAISKTNYAPRVADGQISQMVSSFSDAASLDIATFDGDGDSVALSVIDADGGNVQFSSTAPNRLFASFPDTQSVHTVKIGLSDGKETTIQELVVLRYDANSIQSFYSDVDPSSYSYIFDDIAFATVAGVVVGQEDPNDPLKRIFRPTDDASMAEVLGSIIKAGRKAGLIDPETSRSYLSAYPSWAIPYYTLAREVGAVGDLGGDLSIHYPTREQVAEILVKLLGLDEKLSSFTNIAATFDDAASFSSDAMYRYAQYVKVFGLFMTGPNAYPQDIISRAEVTGIVKRLFMIPSADVVVTPALIEYGDLLSVSLTNQTAYQVSVGDYSLVDNVNAMTSSFALNQTLFSPQNYDSSLLKVESPNSLAALLDNNGVRNVIVQDLLVALNDNDFDGIKDAVDLDDDNDGIPDALELALGLNPLNALDAMLDTDNDGISNVDEYQTGRNPVVNEAAALSPLLTMPRQTGFMTGSKHQGSMLMQILPAINQQQRFE